MTETVLTMVLGIPWAKYRVGMYVQGLALCCIDLEVNHKGHKGHEEELITKLFV